MHIVRTLENRIPFQTFEKWRNVRYRYVSYIKSATTFVFSFDVKHSNILRGPVMFVVFVLVAFVEGST